MGLHMKIQPIADCIDMQPIGQIDQNNLTRGMHAGIGATRRNAWYNGATAQTSGRLLQNLLHGDTVYLSLPSDERPAVILEL